MVRMLRNTAVQRASGTGRRPIATAVHLMRTSAGSSASRTIMMSATTWRIFIDTAAAAATSAAVMRQIRKAKTKFTFWTLCNRWRVGHKIGHRSTEEQ